MIRLLLDVPERKWPGRYTIYTHDEKFVSDLKDVAFFGTAALKKAAALVFFSLQQA